MSWFTKALIESTIIQGVVTLALVGVVSYLAVSSAKSGKKPVVEESDSTIQEVRRW